MRKPVKILLIVPPFYRFIGYYNRYFPLGMAYLAAVLQKEKHEVLIYDADCNVNPSKMDFTRLEDDYPLYLKALGQDRFLFRIITDKVEENLNRFKPDLVGISSFTQNYRIVKKYASLCKKRNLPVIVGGIHITLMPESFSADMDVGVLQEGEQTMVELVKLYEKTT